MTMAPPDTLVVGVGNEYMGDDGAGCMVVNALSELNLHHLEVLDCGTDLFQLASVNRRYQTIVIVDSIAAGEPPGRIHWFAPRHAVSFSMSGSVHQLSILEVLQLLPLMTDLLEGVEFYIIGIEPGILEFQEPLSSEVAAAVTRLVDTLKTEPGVESVLQWCREHRVIS